MMNELDLIGDEEIVPQAFVVDTLEKAEWALRRKGREEAEINRLELYAMALKNQIDDRLAKIVKPRLATIEAMETLLKPWASTEIAKQGKAKSYKLLSGTVGFRQAPPRLEVKDEKAAVEWLKREGLYDLIRIKEEVKKTETKKLIEEKGELPDGVTLIPGEVHFYANAEPPLLEVK